MGRHSLFFGPAWVFRREGAGIGETGVVGWEDPSAFSGRLRGEVILFRLLKKVLQPKSNVCSEAVFPVIAGVR